MSAGDPRYYQLWAGRSKPSATYGTTASASGSGSGPGSTTSYRIDLDAPGGVTYAPSEIANHNAKRRLFIPRKGARDEEYDYGYEIAQRLKAQARASADAQSSDDVGKVTASLKSSNPFSIGEEEEDSAAAADKSAEASEPSAAQVYAQSIDMTPREREQLAATSTQETIPEESEAYADGSEPKEHEEHQHVPVHAAPSVAPSDARSYRSTLTAADVARRQGVFQSPAMIANDASVVNTFRPPPSISGDSYRSVDPWNVQPLKGRREFDKLTQEERDRGLTRFEEYSGEGNAPTLGEVEMNADRDAGPSSDAATIKTARTAATTRDLGSLRVSDLFIPDPRPFKPLRLVRRTDPRQVLVLCAGVALTPQQTQSLRAAQAAANSGIKADEWKTEQAQKLLADFGSDDASDLRGGLGVYFCPPDPSPADELGVGAGAGTELDVEGKPTGKTGRSDANFSRRMERVAFPHKTTARRAALRSVLAALEYIKWEEEGFDKIVVGVAQEWIVRGIAYDVHEWRANGWRLTRQTAMGLPGDTVPDQDLWELLDRAVSGWEESDCSVRFWQVGKEDVAPARELAELGAAKDDQQPHMVKWTRRTRVFH